MTDTPGVQTDATETYPFDRRRSRRTRVHGEASVAFFDGKAGGALGRVRFIDASVTGLGVQSDCEVAIGTKFSLFPDNVRQSSWTGRVVRCTPESEGGFRVGLALGA